MSTRQHYNTRVAKSQEYKNKETKNKKARQKGICYTIGKEIFRKDEEKMLGISRQIWLWVFGGSISLVLLIFVWESVSKMIKLDDNHQTHYPWLGQKLTSKEITRINLLSLKKRKGEIRALIREALNKEIDPEQIPPLCIALMAFYKNPEAYKEIPDVDDVS